MMLLQFDFFCVALSMQSHLIYAFFTHEWHAKAKKLFLQTFSPTNALECLITRYFWPGVVAVVEKVMCEIVHYELCFVLVSPFSQIESPGPLLLPIFLIVTCSVSLQH